MTKISPLAACIAVLFAVHSQALPNKAINARAGVRFDALDMSSRGSLLFTVNMPLPYTSYSTLFVSNAADALPVLRPLTCYPEQIELLSDGRFQVRSRYGIATYNTNTSILHCDDIDDIPTNTMRLPAISQSPDGKWACFVRRRGIIEGSLVLRNTASGKEYILSDKYDKAQKTIPIKWSPDSTVFIYSKDGKVYFCDATALALGILIDDKYRTIGEGTIQSVNWAVPQSVSADSWSKPCSLFHIEGDMISVIAQNGLYTQSLYADIIGHGKPCGRLPYNFDPKSDLFSVRSDGRAIAVLKGGSLLSVYAIKEGAPLLKASSTIQVSSASAPLINAAILWGASGDALVWTAVMPWGGKEMAVVYRAPCKDSSEQGAGSQGTVLMRESGRFKEPVISPNGRRVAFFDDRSLRVCDTDTWQVQGKYTAERIEAAVWDGNYAMYLGGESTVSRWIVGDSATETLFPSAAISGKWNGGAITAVCPNGKTFDAAITPQGVCWSSASSEQGGTSPSLQNGRYRAFCAPSPNPLFDNALYIRDLQGNGSTRTVCASCRTKRQPKRKVALVLDAYKKANNLAPALHALEESGVKGTVFINGEFITRYPAETKSIAMSGATCASMFFADTDLVGGSFISDDEFIARGLGRNEDEFLRVTGKELLPLWHAPRYKADESIRRAGSTAGYTYIDAVGEETIASTAARGTEDTGVTVARMLSLLEHSTSNALSVTIGSPLCADLDILIEAMLDSGYEIVGAEEL